jgi:hypothetical protein
MTVLVVTGCSLFSPAGSIDWWLVEPKTGTVVTYSTVKTYGDGTSSEEEEAFTLSEKYSSGGMTYYGFTGESGDVFYYIVDEAAPAVYLSKSADAGAEGALCILSAPVRKGEIFESGGNVYEYVSVKESVTFRNQSVKNTIHVTVSPADSGIEEISYYWAPEMLLFFYEEVYAEGEYLTSLTRSVSSFRVP